MCVWVCEMHAHARTIVDLFGDARRAQWAGWERTRDTRRRELTLAWVVSARDFSFSLWLLGLSLRSRFLFVIVSLRDCSLPRVCARARPHLSESVASEKENVWKIAVSRDFWDDTFSQCVCVCLFALITNSFFLSFFLFFTRFVLNVRYFFCLI